MSGIYIPNMEMPKGANDCEFSNEFFTCSLTEERCALERMGIGCPLVSVSGHGRLVDADTLVTELEKFCKDSWVYNTVSHMPTIIPADKDGAE